ncbi:cardiolipin synthase [Apilactobacillus apisilvae]|uniref:Cardiolipin synthase n=1 Tax=Apilactobacillus apisilvae TaxID=2923364 RepID=A0ABY4PG09_9LACO|nr:cardiolipin synthase [Apilactobacillus apisilvae]UQS84753.1 cardiolipin synthase [Apilactobacillus apisilvae]
MDVMTFIDFVILANEILALITVFREEREISATWAWLLVLSFLPVIGFIIYAFVGRKLPKKRLFRFQDRDIKKIYRVLENRIRLHSNPKKIKADEVSYSAKNLVKLFKNSGISDLSRRNHVKIFIDGNSLFNKMISDIEKAKSSINIEFYTFYNDEIGKQVLNTLIKKAKQGIHIHVIYDSWGSMGTTRRFFQPLVDVGGIAEPFLHTHSAITDFRINFRDHRKIVVIDGQIGYVGGFNIGDQYLNRKKKFGNWRDTHLRIIGNSVYNLQAQFILDWNVTDIHRPIDEEKDKEFYFPATYQEGSTNIQIVSSGPDTNLQQIKLGYIKLIQTAKNYCWIQTPYLIPDDSTTDALKSAAMSGVDVRIMLPCKPDHPFVYRATQYYAKQLAKYGVKIYFYQKGFLHAKTIVVDGKVSSVGSANFDFRSFKLNFEINAFLYDEAISQQLRSLYIKDIRDSTLETVETMDKQSSWMKFKQVFSRLFSPIL